MPLTAKGGGTSFLQYGFYIAQISDEICSQIIFIGKKMTFFKRKYDLPLRHTELDVTEYVKQVEYA